MLGGAAPAGRFTREERPVRGTFPYAEDVTDFPGGLALAEKTTCCLDAGHYHLERPTASFPCILVACMPVATGLRFSPHLQVTLLFSVSANDPKCVLEDPLLFNAFGSSPNVTWP